VQVRAAANEIACSREQGSTEDLVLVDMQPYVTETFDHLDGRFGSDGGAVQGSDGRADDQIGTDVAFEQGAKHPDLVGAHVAAATKGECDSTLPARLR
jgi:hypothetical protein